MIENGHPEHQRRRFTFLDFALVIAENLSLVVIAPLVAGAIALGFSFFIPPTYTASARLLPPQSQGSGMSAAQAALVGAIAGTAGGSLSLKNPGDQIVALLKSRNVFDAVVERFDLKKVYDVQLAVDARAKLEKQTRLQASSKDGTVSIEVDDHDPKRAAQIANGLIEELHRVTRTLAVTEAGQRRVFFEQQLKRAKEELTRAEIALRGSGIGQDTLKMDAKTGVESLARLNAQVTAQEVKLASMRAYMTESNPAYMVAAQELNALRGEVAKFERVQGGAKGDGDGARYVTSFRDFKYHEALFDLLLRQYDMARLEEARQGSIVQVLDAAQPPERKSRPSKASIAVLTTACALIVVLLFIFARQAWRAAGYSEESAGKLERLRRLLRLRRA